MILYRDIYCFFFFFQAEDGIRDYKVTGVQTCALPIYPVEVRRLLQRDPDPLIVGQGRTRATECAAAEPGQAVWWRCHAWVSSIMNTSGDGREPSREKVEGTSTSGTASSIAGDRMRRRHDHSAGGRSSAKRSQRPRSAAASYTLW